VADANTTTNSNIILTLNTVGGTPHGAFVSAKTAGTGFSINSLAGDDVLIASRERLNRGETAGFFVTAGQSHLLRDLGAGLETIILFAIATLVFVRRRFFV